MARTSAGGVQAAEVQDAVYTYAEDAEASDSYAITLTPAPGAYSAGQTFVFKANTANTGAATLNVNGLGAVTIKKHTGTDLANNDIQSGSIVTVTYDGTNFQMVSMLANAPAGSGDMTKAVYDTDNDGIVDNAEQLNSQAPSYYLDTDNHTSGTTNKVYTATEQTKLGYITVTQAVDLDQMETDIAALANGMVYKGDWDASAGTFPGSGAAQIGWFYYVSIAGTVDGVDFAVGDNIIAIVDNASTTVYAANWSKHDQTDAVQAVVGLTGSISKAGLLAALNVEDGADVTDAVNIGTSIDGATAKTTPVDADTMPLIDSAASNVLKKVTWANIKATLKTYFDTLYIGSTLGATLDANSNDIINIELAEFEQEVDNGNSGTADTVDWGTGNMQKSTLTGNCTFTFTAPSGPARLQLKLIQDGTGSRTATWPASVKWPSGTAPTLSTAAASIDIITFYYDGSSYYGVGSLNFS